jgi:RNA polymerase sigma factor (TIGR02999 family)
MTDVTQILSLIQRGDGLATEQLFPLVYRELRELAAAKLSHEKPDHTLQPTALVHEAYLRLVDVQRAEQWDSRRHFFAAAAEAMRRILVESARRRQSQKRGGHLRREAVKLDRLTEMSNEQLLDVSAALEQLEQEDSLAAEVVKLSILCRSRRKTNRRVARNFAPDGRSPVGVLAGLAAPRDSAGMSKFQVSFNFLLKTWRVLKADCA